MRITTKVYGMMGAMALTGMVVAGTGVAYLRVLGEELRVATGSTAIKLDLVNAARARAWEMVASLRGAYLYANLNNQAQLDQSEKRWRAAFQRSRDQIAELQPLVATGEGKTNLARWGATLGDFEALSNDYIQTCRQKNFARLAEITPKVQEFADRADEILTRLKDEQRNLLKLSQARSESLRTQSLSVNLSLGGILLAIIVLGVFVVRGMCTTLRAAIRELLQGAEQVAGAAGQVSSSSQSLAQGASEQAATLEETRASSEEVNSLARRNSDCSRRAAEMVIKSAQEFVETNQELDEMVAAIGEISQHSHKISKIIQTIDGIAFQTNILALNAAVEAARAGESGQGFAVVADEVRNLAQRSTQAARETAALIEESISKSGDGKAKVDHVAIAVRTLKDDEAGVKLLIDEVNQGSLEEGRATEAIGKAIFQMQEVTQSAAANSEQTAAAAEELNAQSETLKAAVNSLIEMVGMRCSVRSSR
jgi:methyl-accepting chemotaxis protein/methyl-accepting chemotaxis protein-1 (serine sensor receptor)